MFVNFKSKIGFMFSKILIASGILMIAASVAAIAWKIYSISAFFRTSETAGIGAVGGVIEPFIFIFAGVILVIIGVIKIYKNAETLK